MNFKNEPSTDFSLAPNQQAMRQALAAVRAQFGEVYPLLIDGKAVKSKKTFSSVNPSSSREVVGVVQNADGGQALKAIDAAARAFAAWSQAPQSERASLLRRMASSLRRRKLEFCAWLVYEVGKNWAEADADVAEAIDFLDYYALLSENTSPILTPVSNERNEYRYLPLGVVLVIPPWNFPLAILVGMASAALVTGNTVVLKPSSQSPVIAAKFVQLAAEAGLPDGALNLVTGAGAGIGDLLVEDPRIRMIAFTGSRSVGLRINALAAKTARGQQWIKRVIAEMGGKNAIIVDDSADIDAAVQGVLASAFGYQGQKCSACSRLYVHQKLYGNFMGRLMEKVHAIRQGPADQYEHFMGPVISEDSRKKIERYIALGKRQGKILNEVHGEKTSPEGYFVPPVVIERLPRSSKLFSEEIFGPVLAVERVSSWEEGLALANTSDYGLTGAVFSKDAGHLTQAKNNFFCGNLYLNRKCTGALVGGHPFGGFNMSGTDSKAGGPDYLLLFTQAKAISERL